MIALNSFISYNSFLGLDFTVLSTQSHCVQKTPFLLFLFNLDDFYFFFSPDCTGQASSAALNGSGENSCPHPVPGAGEKHRVSYQPARGWRLMVSLVDACY